MVGGQIGVTGPNVMYHVVMVVHLGHGHVRHHNMEDTIVLVMIQTSWHVPQCHVQVIVNFCDILYIQLDFNIRQDCRVVVIITTFFLLYFHHFRKIFQTGVTYIVLR